MVRRHRRKRLATIWRCPEDLWSRVIKPMLDRDDPPAKTGRPRTDPRQALDGIIYILRTGGQWNALPKQFGDDSSVHRAFQRWVNKGIFDRILAALIERCQKLGAIDWQWQSADGAMGKARCGGIMWEKTPRIAGKTAASASR